MSLWGGDSGGGSLGGGGVGGWQALASTISKGKQGLVSRV